jgi:hypothetical protein
MVVYTLVLTEHACTQDWALAISILFPFFSSNTAIMTTEIVMTAVADRKERERVPFFFLLPVHVYHYVCCRHILLKEARSEKNRAY